MLQAFAILDVKAAAYGLPFFLDTVGIALRSFSDVCADQRSVISKHPQDYSMYHIGTFDPCSSQLTSLPQPVFVCSALQMIEQLRSSARLVSVPAGSDSSTEVLK